MDYQSAFAISAAGMSAEKLRADVAALNLANANTPQSLKGAGFQPLRVLSSARATPAARTFGAMVEQGLSVDQNLSLIHIYPAGVHHASHRCPGQCV